MITKTKIIENVAARTGMKKKEAEVAVNAVIASLEDAFVAGEKVQIAGFGTFEVKERAARVGRNPRTGTAMTIAASKHLSFTAGKTIKDAINQ